jgi:uncharacterized protein (TIGR02646 family)
MIRVVKSQPPPAPLGSSGATHLARLKEVQEANPVACQQPGSKLLDSKKGIYNDARVKVRLQHDQRDKCCYCEWKPTDNYGDVEHFRPKGGVQQTLNGFLEKPGYYWLAYEWSNLYYACIYCNQKYKTNYFPLRNPAARALRHADVLTLEQPLLLDPATEDPAIHLTFEQDTIKALSDRGSHCIQAFGLDRPELIQRRIRHLKLLQYARQIGDLRMTRPLNRAAAKFLRDFNFTFAEGVDEVAWARALWQEAAFDAAEFAGMMRANFPHLPQW